MDLPLLPAAHRVPPADLFNNPALGSSHSSAEHRKVATDGTVVDRQTFDRLMLDHLGPALRFAVRLSGDAAAGEELVQEALVRAAAARDRCRGAASFKPWLFQIVVNVFRDGLRSRPRWASELPDDLTDRRAADPPADAAAAELAQRVAACVSSLPPRQREVIVLVAYEHLTTTEAADVLGITEQNARTNLSLARSEIRRQLAPYFDHERARR